MTLRGIQLGTSEECSEEWSVLWRFMIDDLYLGVCAGKGDEMCCFSWAWVVVELKFAGVDESVTSFEHGC